MDTDERKQKVDDSLLKAMEMYESRIADKSISASEMSIYLKIVQSSGLDRTVSKPPGRSLVADLPFDN